MAAPITEMTSKEEKDAITKNKGKAKDDQGTVRSYDKETNAGPRGVPAVEAARLSRISDLLEKIAKEPLWLSDDEIAQLVALNGNPATTAKMKEFSVLREHAKDLSIYLPWKFFGYWLIHSWRAAGWVPFIPWLLYRYNVRMIGGMLAWQLFRKSEQMHVWFHKFFKWNVSREPRFVRAQKRAYNPRQQYMFTLHPHGVMGEGFFNCVCQHAPEFRERFDLLDGCKITMAAAEIVQYMPFWGEMMGDRVKDATANSMRKIFNKSKGEEFPESIAVAPGGYGEAVYSNYSKQFEVSFIRGHKGWLKLAIEQGVDVVPTYTFGMSDMYWNSSWKRHWRACMAQKTGIPTVCWSGIAGTNIPFSEETVIVTFDAFPTSRYRRVVREGEKERIEYLVDEAHVDYMKYLKTCFDRYKHVSSLTKDKELIFAGQHDEPQNVIKALQQGRSRL